MLDEDVEDIAYMLLKTDRAIPPGTWVDSMMDGAIADHNAEQLKLALG